MWGGAYQSIGGAGVQECYTSRARVAVILAYKAEYMFQRPISFTNLRRTQNSRKFLDHKSFLIYNIDFKRNIETAEERLPFPTLYRLFNVYAKLLAIIITRNI